jgi:hypothetical protein
VVDDGLQEFPGAWQIADPAIFPAMHFLYVEVQHLAPVVQAIPLELAFHTAEFVHQHFPRLVQVPSMSSINVSQSFSASIDL